MTSPIKIVALLDAREGRERELEEMLVGMIAPSRSLAGNLRFDLWKDSVHPGRFVLDELFENSAAVDAQRSSAHFKRFAAQVSSLAYLTVSVANPIDVM